MRSLSTKATSLPSCCSAAARRTASCRDRVCSISPSDTACPETFTTSFTRPSGFEISAGVPTAHVMGAVGAAVAGFDEALRRQFRLVEIAASHPRAHDVDLARLSWRHFVAVTIEQVHRRVRERTPAGQRRAAVGVHLQHADGAADFSGSVDVPVIEFSRIGPSVVGKGALSRRDQAAQTVGHRAVQQAQIGRREQGDADVMAGHHRHQAIRIVDERAGSRDVGGARKQREAEFAEAQDEDGSGSQQQAIGRRDSVRGDVAVPHVDARSVLEQDAFGLSRGPRCEENRRKIAGHARPVQPVTVAGEIIRFDPLRAENPRWSSLRVRG